MTRNGSIERAKKESRSSRRPPIVAQMVPILELVSPGTDRSIPMTTTTPLTCLGHELDLSPDAFGELRESNDILDDTEALRQRMREDGYLFLRDYLDVDQVMDARREIAHRIAEGGGLDLNHPEMEAVTKPNAKAWFGHPLTRHNAPLDVLLYSGPMIAYYERLLGGPR